MLPFKNFDITIKEGTFDYKLFETRDTFPFSIVWIPHTDRQEIDIEYIDNHI